MKPIIALLMLASMAMAFSVAPDYFEVKDSGSKSLDTLDVGISIDCETNGHTVTVNEEGTGNPVAGAKAYLFYTDYTYQALPNPGTTDGSGTAVMSVPGNINFLTALFILRVDKSGFQSREIEFAYEKCFEEPPPDPGHITMPPQPEEYGKDNVVVPDTGDDTPLLPPEETPGQSPPEPPNAAEETVPQEPAQACPLGALLLASLFVGSKI